MSESVIVLSATSWLDSNGWLVALLVGIVAFGVSVWLRRRPSSLLVSGRDASPEEIAARTAGWEAAGASPAVADALARGSRVLAIQAYRQERGVALPVAAAAIDHLLWTTRAKQLEAAGASPAIAEALARGNRALAVRLYRAEHSVGLLEAARAIDRLNQTRPRSPASGSSA